MKSDLFCIVQVVLFEYRNKFGGRESLSLPSSLA